MTRLHPGMRVVVKEGPWAISADYRTPGHYGKITEIDDTTNEGSQASIRVNLVGHIDGGHVDETLLALTEGWFFPEELDVVD